MFNCSCSGPGQPTHWMGQVTAAGYLSASQSASGACVSYNQRKGSVLRSGGRHWCRQFFRAAAWGAAERGRRQSSAFPERRRALDCPVRRSICGPGARCGWSDSFGVPEAGRTHSSAQQQRPASNRLATVTEQSRSIATMPTDQRNDAADPVHANRVRPDSADVIFVAGRLPRNR